MSKNVTPRAPGTSDSCSAASLETATAAGKCNNTATFQGQTNRAPLIQSEY